MYICLKCAIDTWAFNQNPDTCRGMYLVMIVNKADIWFNLLIIVSIIRRRFTETQSQLVQ